MLKQKTKKRSLLRSLSAPVLISAVLIGGLTFGGFVAADQYDEKINELERQNSIQQGRASHFSSKATSYQNAVDRLQQEIDKLQYNINKAQRQKSKVEKQIRQALADLKRFKAILGESLNVMYQEDQITTLEILAGSNNLSDFVTQQEYRAAIQEKVQATLDKINQLKVELEQKQRRLQDLIKDLERQQAAKNSVQAQKIELLNYSRGQQAAYEAEIAKNNRLIASYVAAQIASNRSRGGTITAGDPGRGGYPSIWHNAPMDSMLDNWGMFNRECVSYTAWKVYQRYGYMPYWGGHGNANQWPASAEQDKIPTGTTPKRHSVAIWMSGFYGHAMWVEDVYNNGTIRVSQYNYNWDGQYSEMVIPSSGITYIYFN